MNLLHDEIEEIAERIKLRILAKGPHAVFVKRAGQVSLYHPNDERTDRCYPLDLIGSYTRAAAVADIEDDLRARRREIAA